MDVLTYRRDRRVWWDSGEVASSPEFPCLPASEWRTAPRGRLLRLAFLT